MPCVRCRRWGGRSTREQSRRAFSTNRCLVLVLPLRSSSSSSEKQFENTSTEKLIKISTVEAEEVLLVLGNVPGIVNRIIARTIILLMK